MTLIAATGTPRHAFNSIAQASMPDIIFQFTDGVAYQFDSDEIDAFRTEAFGRVPGLAERISILFCVTMFAYEERYSLLRAILQSIRDLEIKDSTSKTKPASPFLKPPLQGLWHKHFFDARFLPGNYLAAANRAERLRLAHEAFESSKSMSLDDRAAEIVRSAWTDPLDARFRTGQATGEWLVYLPREGKNYYLTCSNHRKSQEEQQKLLDSIIRVCSLEYPDLPKWLEEAREGLQA